MAVNKSATLWVIEWRIDATVWRPIPADITTSKKLAARMARIYRYGSGVGTEYRVVPYQRVKQ